MSMPKGYGPTFDGDPRMKTTDGAVIVDGGRYFNYYDMDWVVVKFGEIYDDEDGRFPHGHPKSETWDGWFSVYGADGEGHRYTLNGERMSSVKPSWVRNR